MPQDDYGSPIPRSTLASRIEARTHGQVRELQVVCDESTVVLIGRARTHYAKQLAQHGAMDLVDGQTIVNRIEVG